jgi:Ser-tRNA(Ala) deacylase AlaX
VRDITEELSSGHPVEAIVLDPMDSEAVEVDSITLTAEEVIKEILRISNQTTSQETTIKEDGDLAEDSTEASAATEVTTGASKILTTPAMDIRIRLPPS